MVVQYTQTRQEDRFQEALKLSKDISLIENLLEQRDILKEENINLLKDNHKYKDKFEEIKNWTEKLGEKESVLEKKEECAEMHREVSPKE